MTPQQIIICEWIKDHAPIAVQMSVRPDNIAWLENAVGEALASARAEGMREAARIAYGCPDYVSSMDLDEFGVMPPDSPYDRGRHDAMRAILSAIGGQK